VSRRSRRSKSHSLPGWLWMLIGLAMGLFVALLVYLDARHSLGREPTEASRGAVQSPRAATKNAASPDNESEPPKPRFDFYTILPELEVFVPQPEDSPDPGAPPTPVSKPGTYVLQTGSFQSNQEADRRKAELALIGIQANIQTVSVDKQTWHRVRIGPFKRLDDLNAIRSLLKEHDIEAILLKVNS
jgi:cell division protein FtsN